MGARKGSHWGVPGPRVRGRALAWLRECVLPSGSRKNATLKPSPSTIPFSFVVEVALVVAARTSTPFAVSSSTTFSTSSTSQPAIVAVDLPACSGDR